ncbi:uncharacterized protein C8Q71DRAFT_855794 [Rhodofomes roseus]|uniref:NmrA-like domain-containing protein n=1 Tax=Rhodofomes roseus TaxID=34475 RepID=A0ABQ8KM57_9APHY|nr:uncharacterized protein C8Q71DRAFT_855794 [Rhodofomes roseus]KAH9839155.1 hypothetical protein C8Q71DRAFT_855794 [Rhodofomes roseus]
MSRSSGALNTVALFGATGMLGSAFLDAFLEDVVEGYKPKVLAFMRPGKDLSEKYKQHPQVQVVRCDYPKGGYDLVEKLRGVDALVSVLNVGGYKSHYPLLDAAIKAGVKRFYPSEYGHHQHYRAPGDPGARILPLWNEKECFIEHLKLHPDVLAGKIEYTLIGAGDIWDQPSEPFWCPWDQDLDTYDFPVVGDGDALADWSSRKDVARYVVATLAKPAISANAVLNFPSETISQNAMVELLRKYAGAKGRTVTVRYFSADDAHRFAADASAAPPEIAKSTNIPVDFYFVVKYLQGSGTFRRTPWECHWDLFPEVKRTTFEDYLKERFGQ